MTTVPFQTTIYSTPLKGLKASIYRKRKSQFLKLARRRGLVEVGGVINDDDHHQVEASHLLLGITLFLLRLSLLVV